LQGLPLAETPINHDVVCQPEFLPMLAADALLGFSKGVSFEAKPSAVGAIYL
jgi:hypothetical protein